MQHMHVHMPGKRPSACVLEGTNGVLKLGTPNSFEASVKRLLLIRFICSVTSEPFVLLSPASHLRDLVWNSRGARALRQLKKKKKKAIWPGGEAGV